MTLLPFNKTQIFLKSVCKDSVFLKTIIISKTIKQKIFKPYLIFVPSNALESHNEL